MASYKFVGVVALMIGCGGNDAAKIDAPSGSNADAPPSGGTAMDTFQAVNVTTLVGASPNTGTAGSFVAGDLVPGTDAAPTLSNSVLGALPGTPPKPLFVGQPAAFDAVEVAVEGLSGHFEVLAGSNSTFLGLDLVTQAALTKGPVTVDVATRTGTSISGITSFTLNVDPRVIICSGDLENHDTDGTNIADLFGAMLEGMQGNPAMPMQIVTGHNNNADVIGGVKGDPGPFATGHREIVWDGVPEALRNKTTFSPTFFDRQGSGSAGVIGGAIFTATGGTGEEVNDALAGVLPNPVTQGPPNNPNTALGGDFSNVNPALAGDLIAFTQNAVFAPIGSNQVDITFHVASTTTPGFVVGMGVVFVSVDDAKATTIEFFDENNVSLNKVTVPPRSAGPFPIPGPLGVAAPNDIPFSFAGYVDLTKRIARVHITNGQVAVDKATLNDHEGTPDVVVLDDIYYGEPNP